MTRACLDQELLLGALVDNELDAANLAMIEAHVVRCEGCREELERLQAVRNFLKVEGVRYIAPELLTKGIASLPEFAPPRSVNDNRLLRWAGPALAGAVAASLALMMVVPPSAQFVMDQEIVSSHVRSLQPGHLTDVVTTNQHIVKPWFNGRIDFSPPVPELADQGFPLAGGRLDSIGGRTVAAIVYKRRLHTVNVFIWPAKDAGDHSFVEDGFGVREWNEGGLRFAAISDIPPRELEQFERAFQTHSESSEPA